MIVNDPINFSLLQNMTVGYRYDKNHLFENIQNQFSPIDTFTPYFSKVYFNVIFPSILTRFLRFADRNFCIRLLLLACMINSLPTAVITT